MAQLLTEHMAVNSPVSPGFRKGKSTAGALTLAVDQGTGILRKVMIYVLCSLIIGKPLTQFYTETYTVRIGNPLILTPMYSDG